MEKGTVYLVGAGPGDAGLLTLRAKELLEQADVVLYDSLIGGEILGHAKAGAELIYVGKRAGQPGMSQAEIQERMIAEAEEDRAVVRLKGGDPMIFGRGGEEAAALRAAEIPYEIVPGVTASLGAAAMASLPLTNRKMSSAVTLLTGHEDPEKDALDIDWAAYAKTSANLAIYMGMKNLQAIAGQLVAGGRAGSTPAAVLEWATTARQRSAYGTLETIAAVAEKGQLGSPAIVFVGPAAEEVAGASWFAERPLFGQRIVLTRTREQSGPLRERLESLGAEVLDLPLIQIESDLTDDTSSEIFSGLGQYDWVLFTSANGVRYFFRAFLGHFADLRSLGFLRIGVVGEATAEPLRELNLKPDLVAEQRDAAGLVTTLMEEESVENRKILMVTGNRNREEPVERLESAGAIVDTFPVYRNVATNLADHPAAADFRERGGDVLVFASPSAAESFLSQVKNLAAGEKARTPETVSIGPTTSDAMRKLGLPVTVEATDPSVTGVVRAILSRWGR